MASWSAKSAVCNEGCDGGWQWNAYYSLMQSGGLESEQVPTPTNSPPTGLPTPAKGQDYPYHAITQSCAFNKEEVVA